MVKSFLIIGLGRFGTSTALTLTALGHEVLGVDKSEEHVNAIADKVLHAVSADSTDERVLNQLGIRNFDCVVICIGDDIRSSVLTTVLCRELGAKRIVAKAQDNLHAKLLMKTGADRVIQPEHDAGVRLARSLVSESIIDSLDISDGFSIHELRVPEEWVGKTMSGLNVRQNYHVSVIALRRGGSVHVRLDPNQPFVKEDTIFAIGENRDLEKLEA